MADLFLVLLKFYAARRLAQTVGTGLAPLLIAEVAADEYNGQPETYWYPQAVRYALLAPQRSGSALGQDRLALARKSRSIVPPPEKPAAAPPAWPLGLRPRPSGLDERGVEMARKAILRAWKESEHFASVSRSTDEGPREIASAASIIFGRAWPKVAAALFAPTEKSPDKLQLFRTLSPAEARQKIAAELNTKLRDVGSADEARLQPNDKNSVGQTVTQETIEPLISGTMVRRLETTFRISSQVIIAEHLFRAYDFDPVEAEAAAALLKVRGQARKTPGAVVSLVSRLRLAGADPEATRQKLMSNNRVVNIAKVADTAARILQRSAERAARQEARTDPSRSGSDPRLCESQVHAERVVELAGPSADVPKAPQVREWLTLYRGVDRPPEAVALEPSDEDAAFRDTTPAIDSGESDPASLPMSLGWFVENHLAKRVLRLVEPGLLWERMVQHVAAAYQLDDPGFDIRPVEEQRNQVAILLGFPELLQPNSLPLIRLLAEAAKRDGQHTAANWQVISRLFGNRPVPELQAQRRQLMTAIAAGFEMALKAEIGEP